MAGIERLGVVKLSSEVAFSSGTTIFTATDNYLLSVIATNTEPTNAKRKVSYVLYPERGRL